MKNGIVDTGIMKLKNNFTIWILIFIALGAYAITTRIWVAEDAYISFRYILNIFSGKGLVFNEGEYVEGFTHPYWLLLVSILHFSGIHFHKGSIILGLLLSLSSIFIYLLSSIKKENYIFVFPAILISHEGFRDFATSGLEVSFTLFMLTILLSMTYGKELGSPFSLGAVVSILYHTRPEMGLLIPFYFFWKIYEKKKLDFTWVFRFGLSILIFAVLYHIFRYIYFNDFFPNTFYAKSGAKSRYYDGFKYLFHFLFYSKFFLMSVLLIVGLFLYKIKNNKLSKDYLIPWREIILAIFVSHYVIRVGGDFMGFRLLLPYFFILLYCISNFLNDYLIIGIDKKYILYTNIILLTISIFLVIEKSNYPMVDRTGIVNERKVYTKGIYNNNWEIFEGIRHDWFKRGLELKKLQSCLDKKDFIITNSITEAKCNKDGFGLGYFSVAAGVNVKVIDELGLTDREIAKSGRKSAHERVGHERSISLDEVISRRTIFCSLDDERYDKIMSTEFGVLLRIDQDFLDTFSKEEYESKIKGLKTLKSSLTEPKSDKDIILLKRLNQLEKIFQQDINDLRESNHSAGECWK